MTIEELDKYLGREVTVIVDIPGFAYRETGTLYKLSNKKTYYVGQCNAMFVAEAMKLVSGEKYTLQYSAQ